MHFGSICFDSVGIHSQTCSPCRYAWEEWTKRVHPPSPQRVREPFSSELRPGGKVTRVDLHYKARTRQGGPTRLQLMLSTHTFSSMTLLHLADWKDCRLGARGLSLRQVFQDGLQLLDHRRGCHCCTLQVCVRIGEARHGRELSGRARLMMHSVMIPPCPYLSSDSLRWSGIRPPVCGRYSRCCRWFTPLSLSCPTS